MRVISGKYKSHPIKTVSNQKTRPTSDKVKEALFHSIGPYFPGGSALDLFAGSGGLGIEALSRGVDHVIFVDKDYQANQLIKENIRQLNLTEQCEIYRTDAFRAIKAAGKRDKKFDYVFLDPPYGKISFDPLFEAMHDAGVLADQALIVCEHDQDEILPESTDLFHKEKQSAKTSLTSITIYRYYQRGNIK
ncbi:MULTISPECIES: 16S rRNA (guanine(966)-N(2))-methyltransferase RsmD [Allobacillus]|uniref:16S rRNA (Guanine(966)-N(2))-methyltransferase RsmD n=1 Tax=Allobacillus halotolerans TaxID=570278 RepID=A0ABS6GMZ4_9BACI|nr:MULTISPECIES: 16S rRNA (guanine(966)-N(2))-methyltransferase RsmD [Allobacillus]MBU6080477.1 16S rRNA (guanine(966)-N(2))-methyltransferase RsmD [Allobacillus halotolerans]TSJ69329.1 16S rRNA (guanine(966)-N(2))-methyltransferase RsmD [Allobacillus sp. SKP2-8]